MFPTVEEEFAAYGRQLAEHPNADSIIVALPQCVFKLHQDGNYAFGCLLSIRGEFLSHLPKLNFH